MNKKYFIYIINFKKKSFGKLLSFISKILINLIRIKIYIINFKKSKFKNLNLYKHTGYPGGIKKINIINFLEKNEKYILTKSIKNMISKNKLKKKRLRKILIFNKKIIKKKIKILNI